PVDLFERKKDELLFVLGNAYPRIADGQMEHDRVGANPLMIHPDDNISALGELHGVPDEVHDDLPKARRVPNDSIGYCGIDTEDDLDSFLMSGDGERTKRTRKGVAQSELDFFDIKLARLDLGKVQNIVD